MSEESNLNVGRFLAAIAYASGAGDAAACYKRAGDACQAFKIDPRTPMKTGGGDEPQNGCRPDSVDTARWRAGLDAGMRWSDHPAASKFASEGKPRFCHLSAGGCGARLPAAALMYYQTAGPKAEYKSGKWKGTAYNATLGPACFEKLSSACAVPVDDPEPQDFPQDEEVPF